MPVCGESEGGRVGGISGGVEYDFCAARERVMELTALYRRAGHTGDEAAQQVLRSLVDELEREIAAAHAAGSKIAVG
ncbi:hypothetical protein [Paenibacillus sp. SYP-B4298]|uniref:hypothetical protein n=1 Tax=Paenibacillus sp. SYP-B4298 TaxID=2996034 RepID=UPI0022DE42FD|nr:hypothetical protein [Paenibacillus sp. SYP-B4298]